MYLLLFRIATLTVEINQAPMKLLGRWNSSVVTLSIDDKLPNSYMLHRVEKIVVGDILSLLKNPQNIRNVLCVFSSHPFWTSMDVPAGVTQEEGHTGFLIHLPSAVRALIFVARRIQPFLSLVDREVEFCVLTN